MNKYRMETRVFLLAIVVIFINVLILHKTFSGLERENMIDPGGTNHGHSVNSHSMDKYSIFESRLRKLTEVSIDRSVHLEHIYTLSRDRASLGCQDIVRMTNYRFLASGWTKAVYSANYNNKTYAVKTVFPQGRDISSCLEEGYLYDKCFYKAAKKLIKEISLLQTLTHPNIIQVFGFCITSDNLYDVSMVTELGDPVELIRLLQMSWEDRLKVAYDITKLLYFMSHNEFGTISINDFRRQQFVRVNGEIKLSDVDDIGFGDPICQTDDDCAVSFPNANFSLRISCQNLKCVGHNEKKNIFNAGRHFTTFLLPHGVPIGLQPLVDRVVHGYSNVTMNTKQLLHLMDKIVLMYGSGSYLNRTGTHIKVLYNKILYQDLPGIYDYPCRLSLTGSGCTVSVFDLQEAEALCNADEQCLAFVFSNKQSWTGRTLIHMKSGIGNMNPNRNTNLYVKPTS
ncbi:extracellular tyrosine-protein kinase PKDCC-like isoform X1 [Mytilus galloprovincialis]|uniref:extracellular tyrosine-protein kinase PKDCC-like isoform X1 n=1 Tax=Mytilus galloprovincialis TaxID=29158 RepID=UPI003F7B5E1B